MIWYDNCGNRTRKDDSSAGITDYGWDEIHRMTFAETPGANLLVNYDADKRLVYRYEKYTEEATRYVYDGRNVLVETDNDGVTQREFTATGEEYGELISQYDGTDTDDYIFDGLGSTDALLDGSQTSTDTYVYRAYGEVTDRTGSSVNAYEYVGRQGVRAEPALDLVRMDRRFYDPATGRFVSEDERGILAGDDNFYRYVFNNPVNLTDPSGLDVFFGENEDNFRSANNFLDLLREDVGVSGSWSILPKAEGVAPYWHVTNSAYNGGDDSTPNADKVEAYLARGTRRDGSPISPYYQYLLSRVRDNEQFTFVTKGHAEYWDDLSFLDGKVGDREDTLAALKKTLDVAGYKNTQYSVERFKANWPEAGGLGCALKAFTDFVKGTVCEWSRAATGHNLCNVAGDLLECGGSLFQDVPKLLRTLWQGRDVLTGALFDGLGASLKGVKDNPMRLVVKAVAGLLPTNCSKNLDQTADRIADFANKPGEALAAIAELFCLTPEAVGGKVMEKLQLPGYAATALEILTDLLWGALTEGADKLAEAEEWIKGILSDAGDVKIGDLLQSLRETAQQKVVTFIGDLVAKAVVGTLVKLVPGAGTLKAVFDAVALGASLCKKVSVLIKSMVEGLGKAVADPDSAVRTVSTVIDATLTTGAAVVIEGLASFVGIADLKTVLGKMGPELVDGLADKLVAKFRGWGTKIKNDAGDTNPDAPVVKGVFEKSKTKKEFRIFARGGKYWIKASDPVEVHSRARESDKGKIPGSAPRGTGKPEVKKIIMEEKTVADVVRTWCPQEREGKLRLQPFLRPSDAGRTADYVVSGANQRKVSGERSRLFIGRGNLGALYYTDGAQGTARTRLPSVMLVVGGHPHTERVLIKMLPEEGCPAVRELYSERYPCVGCDSLLTDHARMHNSGADIDVYFVAPTGSDEDGSSANRLLAIYRDVFHLDWQ